LVKDGFSAGTVMIKSMKKDLLFLEKIEKDGVPSDVTKH